MPSATDEEREMARNNLRNFAAVLLRICTRIAMEDHERAIRANAPKHLE